MLVKTNRESFEYSFNHTKQRMEERYGYSNLTIGEYKKMCKDCIGSEKLKKEFTPRGYQYVCKIRFKGMNVVAVYTSWKRHITTVLPDTFKSQRKGDEHE